MSQAFSTFRLALAVVTISVTCSGCTIQDVFRSTLGGVNSDQASLNKVNPMNDQSYPQDENRTVWRFPGTK
jgi:hypothetical protein